MAKLQGTIYLGQISREAVKRLEETRRREETRDRARELESRKDWLERQDKDLEYIAIGWLRKSEDSKDEAKVLELFEKPLRRYWTRCGYSQRWIDSKLVVDF